jgi:hypothetical protein
MNEILNGIRIIKYYAWERAFSDKIATVRLDELHILKQMAYVTAIGFSLVLQASPIIQPVLVFFAYVSKIEAVYVLLLYTFELLVG